MQRKVLLISALYLLGLGLSQAQLRLSKGNRPQRRSLFEPYSSVGFGIGTSNYYGEMTPINDPINSTFKMPRWNITANYTRHFSPKFSGRVALTYARISADDYTLAKDKPKLDFNFIRNYHFRNDIKELSLTGIYNIIPEGKNFVNRPSIVPYLFGGIAIFAHDPRARTPVDMGNQWVRLQPLGTEGQGQSGYEKPYSLVSASIPVGLGFRFRYKRNWDISAEAGLRFSFTDYLDDLGGTYPTPSDLSDPLAVAMSNRSLEPVAARKGGDRLAYIERFQTQLGTNNGYISQFGPGDRRGGGMTDVYLLTAVHINYIITPKIKCPPIR